MLTTNTLGNETTFKLGELFSGPGGIALAAKSSRVIDNKGKVFSIAHGWATDYDRDTCETYRLNICPDKPETVICKDIRKLDFTGLEEIDGLAFGFPCNDFSVVGEQKGINGVYGPLYSYGITALNIFKPMWFMAENVGGLRNSNEGKAFQTILEKLDEADYKLVPHLYKFEKYGVPQARHRIIIIGIRKDIDIDFKVPSPEPYKNIDVSAKSALESPPIPVSAANQEKTNHTSNVVERLKYIRPGENAFNASMPNHLRLDVKATKISQIYKRLNPEKPAYTVTGSGGGGTYVYHWAANRALTNRERARLQTFPDDFVFVGSKQSVRKQIGMAVPPRGAQVIFEALLKSFAHVEYATVPANIEYSHSFFSREDVKQGTNGNGRFI